MTHKIRPKCNGHIILLMQIPIKIYFDRAEGGGRNLNDLFSIIKDMVNDVSN